MISAPLSLLRNIQNSSSYFCQRALTTWSHLATAFNTKPTKKFSLRAKTGLFGLPELRESNGFYLMKENVMIECEMLIEECLSSSRTRPMVEIFDQLSNTICKVADLAEFVRLAHPENKYTQAAEMACLGISRVVEKLNTNQELYLALRDVTGHRDICETNDVDEHVANLFLFDFEQSGIHLNANKRSQVVYLNELILYTGQQFSANSTKPVEVNRDMIPVGIQSLFPSENGVKLLVTGLFPEASSEIARETAYKLYLKPDVAQDELLTTLLSARNQLANVCGFPSYAHRALQGSLAESPTLVAKFLEDLSDNLFPRAEKDFSLMTRMKKSLVQVWDATFYVSEAKRTLLNVDRTDFMPYFSVGTCMEGLNNLCRTLFNIELITEETEPGEVWNTDVYKLAVVHGRDGKLGNIYCDFYERDGKPHQDCHFTIQGGKELENGVYQNPIVVVMLNFPSRPSRYPSLLMPSMVDNLFHEMGHALHSMMARTKYQHVTGTRCTTDFAEVPSILLEYFASDPRVLATFARHYQTGETMPESLRQKYSLAKHVFAASDMQVQNFYAALDQKLHTEKFPLEKQAMEILEEVHTKFYALPYVPHTAWHLRFGHLVGYGAKYYSYLMSRAVASWIWHEYFIADPLNSSSGEKYRCEILAHGGGVPAKNLVSNFLGKDITSDNLTHALMVDLDSNQKRLDKFLTTAS